MAEESGRSPKPKQTTQPESTSTQPQLTFTYHLHEPKDRPRSWILSANIKEFLYSLHDNIAERPPKTKDSMAGHLPSLSYVRHIADKWNQNPFAEWLPDTDQVKSPQETLEQIQGKAHSNFKLIDKVARTLEEISYSIKERIEAELDGQQSYASAANRVIFGTIGISLLQHMSKHVDGWMSAVRQSIIGRQQASMINDGEMEKYLFFRESLIKLNLSQDEFTMSDIESKVNTAKAHLWQAQAQFREYGCPDEKDIENVASYLASIKEAKEQHSTHSNEVESAKGRHAAASKALEEAQTTLSAIFNSIDVDKRQVLATPWEKITNPAEFDFVIHSLLRASRTATSVPTRHGPPSSGSGLQQRKPSLLLKIPKMETRVPKPVSSNPEVPAQPDNPEKSPEGNHRGEEDDDGSQGSMETTRPPQDDSVDTSMEDA